MRVHSVLKFRENAFSRIFSTLCTRIYISIGSLIKNIISLQNSFKIYTTSYYLYTIGSDEGMPRNKNAMHFI